MIGVQTSRRITKVVKFFIRLQHLVFSAAEKQPVCPDQLPLSANPNVFTALIAFCDPATRLLVDFVFKVFPVWNVFRVRDSAHVFFVGHGFHVKRVDATPITTKVVQLKTIWNRSKILFPKPNVTQPKPWAASNSRISAWSACLKIPAASYWINCVFFALCVCLVNIQHGQSANITAGTTSCKWCRQAASAQTDSRPFNSIGGAILPVDMPAQKLHVAAGNVASYRAVPIRDGHVSVATTEAFSTRVRSPRIIGALGVCGPVGGSGCVALKVFDELTFDRTARRLSGPGNILAATAHTPSAWIGRCRVRSLRLHDAAIVTRYKSRFLSFGMFRKWYPQYRIPTSASAKRDILVFSHSTLPTGSFGQESRDAHTSRGSVSILPQLSRLPMNSLIPQRYGRYYVSSAPREVRGSFVEPLGRWKELEATHDVHQQFQEDFSWLPT